jgi:predicted permease
MKEGGSTASSLGRRVNLRNALVALQVGISALLLVVAGLELRSLQKGLAADPGFRPDHVLTASFNLAGRDYESNGGLSRLEGLLERVRSLPGVASVSLADRLPLSGRRSRIRFRPEGGKVPDGDRKLPSAEVLRVSPGHFASLKVSLLQGRDFETSDLSLGGGSKVAIVNSAFARRYWPEEGAFGRRLTMEGTDVGDLEVIGVVADVSYTTLEEKAGEPVLYLPFQPMDQSEVNLLIRVNGKPEAWISAVREAFVAADPDLAVDDIFPLREQLSRAVLPYRSIGALFGAMSAASLLLAAIGIHGVASYSVRQRKREIGIRMALGAAGGDVLSLILEGGLAVVGVGLVGGLLTSLGVGKVLASFLFGVNATDPLTLVAVTLIILGVAFLAIFIPGIRATRVELATVLRQG